MVQVVDHQDVASIYEVVDFPMKGVDLKTNCNV